MIKTDLVKEVDGKLEVNYEKLALITDEDFVKEMKYYLKLRPHLVETEFHLIRYDISGQSTTIVIEYKAKKDSDVSFIFLSHRKKLGTNRMVIPCDVFEDLGYKKAINVDGE